MRTPRMPPVSTRSLKKALGSGYLFSFHPEQLWNSARATGPAYLVESAPGSQCTDATPRRAATNGAVTCDPRTTTGGMFKPRRSGCERRARLAAVSDGQPACVRQRRVLCSVQPLHCLSSDCSWLGSFEWRRCATIASPLFWPAHLVVRAQLACRRRAAPYESTQSLKFQLDQ